MGFNSGITLYGYYSEDPALLDEIVLPEGLDRGELVIEILHSCGSLYPFIQHPEMLKESVHNWFAINERNFERILLAVMAEYSPIENYDRTEEHRIIRSGNETENGTNQNNRNENTESSGIENSSSTENSRGTENSNGSSYSSSVTSTDGSETDQRAADNSENFRNTTKKISEADSNGTDNSTTSASGSSTSSGSTSNSGSFSNTNYTNSAENGRFQTDRNKSENETESIRAHGNIGTTRNSEMVLDEINLRKYNIYEDIASRFADKFLLCIY